MPTALIIGSGPAAAGVALALTADPNQQVTVMDVGLTLEPELEMARIVWRRRRRMLGCGLMWSASAGNPSPPATACCRRSGPTALTSRFATPGS